MKKALFLDRDGVINHDPGDYTYSLEEFHLLPTALEAMKFAYNLGYTLIVVTNQAGISRGLYPKKEWVERACAKFKLNRNESLMIGDRDRDVQCAEAAGVRGFQMEKNGRLIDLVKMLCV